MAWTDKTILSDRFCKYAMVVYLGVLSVIVVIGSLKLWGVT